MTRILFFLIFLILFSNIIILGKGEDIFENQRKTLNNILLEGDITTVIKYFKIQDSLQSNNLSSNEQNNILEYKKFKQKYLMLVKRIEFICAKSEIEIKNSYSHFLPIQTAFEKRLISNNSVKAFKKFIFFFLNNNYYEAAKFINITFFLNYDEKTLSLNKFKEAYSNFSEELDELESTIDCGDLENSIFLENRMDSLIYFLPDSTKVIKERYLNLKDKLKEQKIAEKNLLCSIDELFFERKFSINLGFLLDHSSRKLTELKGLDYFYDIPSNVGLGFSFLLDYHINESFFIGAEIGLFEYNYKYIGIFRGYYDQNNNPHRFSKDLYGFRNLNLSAKLYSIYLQYKYPNRTVFHPFVRLSYGQVFTIQSISKTNKKYSESIYNMINNVKTTNEEFKYGLGVEIVIYFSDRINISLLYSSKIRSGDVLSNQSSGRFEVIAGFYW